MSKKGKILAGIVSASLLSVVSVSATTPEVSTSIVKSQNIKKVTHADNKKHNYTPIPSDDHVVAQVPIKVLDNVILFDAQEPKTRYHIEFQLDTGAYEPLINPADAQAMHLPNLGPIEIQGVTGTSQAYMSEMSVTIGGVTFRNIPCIVDPDFQDTSLFGYSFFSDNNYDLLVSLKYHTMTVLK